jgi:hypothetical protein
MASQEELAFMELVTLRKLDEASIHPRVLLRKSVWGLLFADDVMAGLANKNNCFNVRILQIMECENKYREDKDSSV